MGGICFAQNANLGLQNFSLFVQCLFRANNILQRCLHWKFLSFSRYCTRTMVAGENTQNKILRKYEVTIQKVEFALKISHRHFKIKYGYL